jgi:hypothetical protein
LYEPVCENANYYGYYYDYGNYYGYYYDYGNYYGSYSYYSFPYFSYYSYSSSYSFPYFSYSYYSAVEEGKGDAKHVEHKENRDVSTHVKENSRHEGAEKRMPRPDAPHDAEKRIDRESRPRQEAPHDAEKRMNREARPRPEMVQEGDSQNLRQRSASARQPRKPQMPQRKQHGEQISGIQVISDHQQKVAQRNQRKNEESYFYYNYYYNDQFQPYYQSNCVYVGASTAIPSSTPVAQPSTMPVVTPTNQPVVTPIPTAASPSQKPSFAPVNYPVTYFGASQVIDGISLSTFNSSYNYTLALAASIADTMVGVTASDIYALEVTNSVSSSVLMKALKKAKKQGAKALLTVHAKRTEASSGTAVSASYDIYVIETSSSLSYSSLSSQLVAGVTSGAFNSYLNNNSVIYGASGLAGCTSSSVSTINFVTSEPTMQPTIRGGAIAAIVIGVLVAIGSIAFGIYYYMYQVRFKSDEESETGSNRGTTRFTQSTHTDQQQPQNTENPIFKASVGNEDL